MKYWLIFFFDKWIELHIIFGFFSVINNKFYEIVYFNDVLWEFMQS